MLAQGIDPAVVKRTTATTFESAARTWHERWKIGRSARHADYVLRRLEADVFPRIGSRPLQELAASAFREVVQKIEGRGAVDIAKRVLQTCSQVMRHAVAHDLVGHNPVGEIKPSDVLKPRKRRNYPRVAVSELPDLLRAMDGYVGGEHTRLALQLMALTFVRTSELIGARWTEFEFDELRWSIPAERMKMRTPHIVPLSTQATCPDCSDPKRRAFR